MKYKGIFSVILFCAVAFLMSCQDPELVDYKNRDPHKDELSVTAYLDEARQRSVQAEINHAAKTIVFNLPYYASDIEPIVTPVNNLFLMANPPTGALITPELRTVRDLTNPVTITIEYVNSEKEQFEMSVNLVRSNRADILGLTLVDVAVPVPFMITIEDGVDKILFFRTSSVVYDALQNAQVDFSLSPWASIEGSSGIMALDLTVSHTITVRAHDGTTKEYVTEMVNPEYVEYGEIGQMSALFGLRTSTTDPLGFVGNSNRSLAVVGNELIVANDNGDFLRFNRFTGVRLNATVATPNVGSYLTMAIDADDNGVLLMTVFVFAGNAAHSPTIDFYVWKNGLDAQPTRIFTKPATDLIATGNQIGRTISVKGDLISGKAVIGLLSNTSRQGFMFRVVDGVVTNGDAPWTKTFTEEFNNNGKLIPLSADDEPAYILAGVANREHQFGTVTPDVLTPIPPGALWTANIKGADYIEFNGVKMLAAQSGFSVSSGNDTYNKLVIGEITDNLEITFTENTIVDFRMQNIPNLINPANGLPFGDNPSLTGMTRWTEAQPLWWSSEHNTVIGNNGNLTGDVCFGKNEDGTSVQVYMLTTGHGMLAYDITRFKPF